jgi:hypothetical protein
VLCAGSALLLAEDESTSIVKRRPCWSVTKPVRITFSRIVCSSLDRLSLGFLTEGKLAAIFIKTFSWGFPTGRSFTSLISYTITAPPLIHEGQAEYHFAMFFYMLETHD